MAVYQALDRARYSLPEAVILIRYEELWQPEWSRLLGINESDLLA